MLLPDMEPFSMAKSSVGGDIGKVKALKKILHHFLGFHKQTNTEKFHYEVQQSKTFGRVSYRQLKLVDIYSCSMKLFLALT